jgi:hypothetical protein
MDFDQLIQQPESRRDESWETDFLTQFVQLKVQLEGDQAKQGPDGWPYLYVRTVAQGSEPVLEIIRWLAAKGIGLVVNPHKMIPDYVFTYGMLWNFVETGRFTDPSTAAPGGEAVFHPDRKMIFGPPSEKYLPHYVRSVMREFLRAQGFLHPKVLVATTADYGQTDLLLSIDSIGGIAKAEQGKFAEMMGWFLPLHYSLVLADSQGLPAFHAL